MTGPIQIAGVIVMKFHTRILKPSARVLKMTKNHLRTAKQRGKGLGRNLPIGSVARTFKVMEQLAQASGPMSIAALAQVTGRPKSSLHRVLSTLVHAGFVEQDRETGKYRLIPRSADNDP